MIGIIGTRGVGKTTMILQHIKEQLDSNKALYVSADDMFFGEMLAQAVNWNDYFQLLEKVCRSNPTSPK